MQALGRRGMRRACPPRHDPADTRSNWKAAPAIYSGREISSWMSAEPARSALACLTAMAEKADVPLSWCSDLDVHGGVKCRLAASAHPATRHKSKISWHLVPSFSCAGLLSLLGAAAGVFEAAARTPCGPPQPLGNRLLSVPRTTQARTRTHDRNKRKLRCRFSMGDNDICRIRCFFVYKYVYCYPVPGTF